MTVVAVCCSDLHLSDKPPAWRRAEPDWFAAMRRPLRQIRALAKKHNVPVLCAGDVFDRWTVSPELISFAMKNLPVMYSIPGQHDLPNHRMDLIHKSAYHVLQLAGVLLDPSELDFVAAYPWEVPPDKMNRKPVVLAHRYVWIDGYSFGANSPEEGLASRKVFVRQYGRPDLLIFGDNHKGFVHRGSMATIFNCGSMMKRNSDQDEYCPMVGLVVVDSKGRYGVRPHYLNTSDDVYSDDVVLGREQVADNAELLELMKEYASIQNSSSLDFEERLLAYCESNHIEPQVKEIIRSAIQDEA